MPCNPDKRGNTTGFLGMSERFVGRLCRGRCGLRITQAAIAVICKMAIS